MTSVFDPDRTDLDPALASRFVQIALANVSREYPNHPGHLLNGPEDAGTPRELHPAFYGSYDWHSCVHMHWLLARVRRLRPAVAEGGAIARVFDAHLTPSAVAGEVAYFARPGLQSFQRTYGWAWLLELAGELAMDARFSADAKQWHDALAPLTATIVTRYGHFMPRAAFPIRHGMHPNSAFGLLLALQYARTAGNQPFASAVAAKARDWFGADCDLPARWEPSGADFLSPALVEAHLMASVLEGRAFGRWLADALPGLAAGEPSSLFAPVPVSDRADPQIVHLDGLNLSRAWNLQGIAKALPADDPRRARLLDSARLHLAAGLEGLDSGEYVGAHWLATFATLALTSA